MLAAVPVLAAKISPRDEMGPSKSIFGFHICAGKLSYQCGEVFPACGLSGRESGRLQGIPHTSEFLKLI